MPIHNWSLVNAGVFHHFHHQWIAVISDTLNAGLLPADYYALSEQIAGSLGPDVLALEIEKPSQSNGGAGSAPGRGSLLVNVAPPQVPFMARTEMTEYVRKQNRIVIRHSTGDQIVALVEILSPGNKSSRQGLRSFVEKAAEALARGWHLLVIDLHPPTARDPQGIHGAVCSEICDDSYQAPPDKPLTLAAYSAGPIKTAYVQPVAVGDTLPDMPLFLEPEEYVNVPMEATYQATWRGFPRRWKDVLERCS